MTLAQVVALIQRKCDVAGGQSAWAKSVGLSPAFVSDVLRGKREPGPTLLEALGLERGPAVYRRVKR